MKRLMGFEPESSRYKADALTTVQRLVKRRNIQELAEQVGLRECAVVKVRIREPLRYSYQ